MRKAVANSLIFTAPYGIFILRQLRETSVRNSQIHCVRPSVHSFNNGGILPLESSILIHRYTHLSISLSVIIIYDMLIESRYFSVILCCSWEIQSGNKALSPLLRISYTPYFFRSPPGRISSMQQPRRQRFLSLLLFAVHIPLALKRYHSATRNKAFFYSAISSLLLPSNPLTSSVPFQSSVPFSLNVFVYNWRPPVYQYTIRQLNLFAVCSRLLLALLLQCHDTLALWLFLCTLPSLRPRTVNIRRT